MSAAFVQFAKNADILSIKTWCCFSSFNSLEYLLFLLWEKGRKENKKEILHNEMEISRFQNLRDGNKVAETAIATTLQTEGMFLPKHIFLLVIRNL